MTCHKTMNQNENWIFQVQKKKKKLLKKRFETTLTQNQLSLNLENNITEGMKKLFFVIFYRICPILGDLSDFSSGILHRYGHF